MYTLFLVNPRSGGGMGRRLLPLLAEQAASSFESPIVLDITTAPSSYSELIRDGSVTMVVVVGGDGTFSSLLPDALASQKPFGILPLGTGNDLAKEMGIYRKISRRTLPRALRALADAGEKTLDVWMLEYECEGVVCRRLFCNYASFGLDAEVLRSFEVLRSSASVRGGTLGVVLNRARYVRAGISHLSYALPASMKLSREAAEGRDIGPCVNLLFPNIRSYMGLGGSCETAGAFDGKIPAVIMSSRLAYPRAIALGSAVAAKDLLPAAAEWYLDTQGLPVPMQCDGEAAPMSCRGRVGIRKAGTIKVLCR